MGYDNRIFIGFIIFFYIFNCVFKCTVSCGTACNNGNFFALGKMLFDDGFSMVYPLVGAENNYLFKTVVYIEFFYGMSDDGLVL